MAKVKCRYCGKNISKDDAYSPKSRLYFCDEECYKQWCKSDDGQLDELLDYVWHLYSPPKQTSSTYIMIKRQAEHYHNVDGFKYKGMFLAVWYYVEILERLWKDEYGLGQVLPTYYITLQHLYEEQRVLKDKLKQSEQPKEKVMQGSNKIVKRKTLSLD